MKKIILLLFIFSLFELSAFPIPQFDSFRKNLSLQTEKWQSENDAKKETREYLVGDTEDFWRWDLSVMPPTWILEPATCRAVGEHCYLFVADDQWNLNMDQTDVDTVMVYLEEKTMNTTDYGVIEMDELLFGPIPDEIDNDPKIIVFYSALGSYMGSMFDGYFSPYNQVTEQQAQQMNPPGHSNECEMIYMTCHPLNPTEPIRISVLAHELQHMIHWGQDVNEDIWVDEGCAELAMVYFGLPDPINGFPTNSDNSLIEWNQQFADYVKVMLFFTYLEEHYDSPADSLIKDIVAEPANGITGISNQLNENNINKEFDEIFFDWTIANFIDHPSAANGLYNYELLELPNFHTVQSHNSFPAGFSSTANPWAADYIKIFPPASGLSLEISLNQDEQQIAFIKKYLDSEESDVEINLINQNWITEIPSEWYNLFEYVTIVYASHHHEILEYEYSLTELSFGYDKLVNPQSNFLKNYPNPFNPSTTISFSLNTESTKNTEIVIYNLKGQKIRTLDYIDGVNAASSQMMHSIVWDGRDDNNKLVGSGNFLYQVKADGKIVAKNKMLLIK